MDSLKFVKDYPEAFGVVCFVAGCWFMQNYLLRDFKRVTEQYISDLKADRDRERDLRVAAETRLSNFNDDTRRAT